MHVCMPRTDLTWWSETMGTCAAALHSARRVAVMRMSKHAMVLLVRPQYMYTGLWLCQQHVNAAHPSEYVCTTLSREGGVCVCERERCVRGGKVKNGVRQRAKEVNVCVCEEGE